MTTDSGPARMAERRRECGLTQAQLGALIGMTQGQLSNLERKNRPAGIGTALAIARALTTTVEALWGTEAPNKTAPKPRPPRGARRRQKAPRHTAKNQGFPKR